MHVVFRIGKWYTFLHICQAFNAETIQFPRGMKNILTVFFSMMKWFAAWRCNILARMNLYPLVMKTDGWKWHQIMKGRARQAQAVKKDHLTRPKAFSNHLGVYVSIVGIFINESGHGYLNTFGILSSYLAHNLLFVEPLNYDSLPNVVHIWRWWHMIFMPPCYTWYDNLFIDHLNDVILPHKSSTIFHSFGNFTPHLKVLGL